ncbi:MAG: glycosyl hydrolase family 18 protein [Spirochaetota bacterium]
MKRIKTVYILWWFVWITPAHTQQLWGYYLKNSMPYQKHAQYWDNRFATLSVLCFTGITIHNTGCSIPAFTHDTLLFNKAQNHKIALVAHISFSSIKAGLSFLTSSKYWHATITKLSHAIHKNTWAGCHFDFEYIPASNIQNLVEFLKYFRAIAPEISLSMAVFPQVEFNNKHAAFHNFAIIWQYVDAIVLMCYDYHNPKTKPGPVTSIEWTKKNIEYALRYFKPHHIWLGIPAYGYMWKNDRYYSVITMKSLPQYISLYSNYRHSSGTVALEYIHNNDHFVAYIPDAKLHKELIALATHYMLKGIALWRLGYE